MIADVRDDGSGPDVAPDAQDVGDFIPQRVAHGPEFLRVVEEFGEGHEVLKIHRRTTVMDKHGYVIRSRRDCEY